MKLKTYVAQYIHKYGNGWAIINATDPSKVESILKTQGRFPEVKLVSFKEVCYFGNTMSIVYEGSITTLGQTPYDLAVENGFKGTLKEWLESLKGDKGDTGAVGPQGNTGPQGPQGERGEQGVSVVSVEQIETSHASGGVNVIRETLSNGLTYDFEVRNGEKFIPVYEDGTLTI